MDEEMIRSASQLNHTCHALIGPDLLNKGPNLIPTMDTANIDSAIDSVSFKSHLQDYIKSKLLIGQSF